MPWVGFIFFLVLLWIAGFGAGYCAASAKWRRIYERGWINCEPYSK